MMPENTCQSEIHSFNCIYIEKAQFDWRSVFLKQIIFKDSYRFLFGMPTSYTFDADAAIAFEAFDDLFEFVDAHQI